MTARCLSVHAGYRCRHSGACCSGVFPIPAEAHVVELARRSGPQGNLRTGISIFRAAGRPGSDPEFLPTGEDGACIFFERESRLCALHRVGGPSALPTACRHFPRVFLRDGRGLSVTLSHFCPTAAGMLLGDAPLDIVESAPTLELDGDVEAFEATGALPPLLRPGMLTDLEAFDLWERAAIATFARDDLTCDEAIAAVSAATEMVRMWDPGGRSLAAVVEKSFEAAAKRHVTRQPPPEGPLEAFDGAVKRYLAAKVFANRIAYECRGLRSLVGWLRTCLEMLRAEAASAGETLNEPLFIEAVRATDLALVHRTDTAALAHSLARIEQQP